MSVHPNDSNAQPSVKRWPTYQPMVLLLFAFSLGVVIDRNLQIDWRISFSIALLSLLLWLCRYFSQPFNPEFRCRKLNSVLLLIGLVCLGSFWHHGRWNWFGAAEIGRFATEVSQPCCIEALVVSEPRWVAANSDSSSYRAEELRTRLTIKVNRIRDGVEWRQASGLTDLVIHLPTEHVRAGDKVRVFGRLVSSSPPTNPGQFDFRAFYRARGKLAFVHAYHRESVQVIEPAGWASTKLLSKLRQKLNDFTWLYVEKDEAAFASAVLLGNREQLSKSRRDNFMETGTVHLLAISGLHVGILAGSFFLFFRLGLFSRQTCLLVTILFVFFYAWLVEFRPPVSRATILIVLFCVGRLCGENNFSFNLLAIAGLIVLILNPSDLFGIGPQLSFLAVATLTFGREWVFWKPSKDPIKRLISSTRPIHVRTINWIGRQSRTAILVSGLIWLLALPLVAYRFNLVAPVALLINPLLLIPIAWALYGGLGVMVFGWFAPPLASVSGWFCQTNLLMIEWMIGVAHSIPMSHAWTAGPMTWAVITFYCGVFLFAIYPPSRLNGRWLAGLVIAWFLFCWLVPDVYHNWNRQQNTDSLCCDVIDVGHGSSVLLQLPGGKTVLYDAGSLGSSEFGARNIAGALWHERIKRLDAIVLSHADVDHFNAVQHLVGKFSVGEVIVSSQMLSSESCEVQALFTLLKAEGIPIRTVAAGDTLSSLVNENVTDCKLEILSPLNENALGNDNSNSIVLLVSKAGKRILLPGDLEGPGLKRLLNIPAIDCDFVVAAHHGSRNSLPEEFMRWASPEFVAISGGSQRVSGKMIQSFSNAGREVASTDRDGAIRFEINSEGVRLKRWNREPW